MTKTPHRWVMSAITSPDNAGGSEYRAAYELLQDAMEPLDTDVNQLESARAILDELAASATAIKDMLPIPRELTTDAAPEQASASQPQSTCPNCPWHGPDSELAEIHRLAERVQPGEPMPSGECPRCGALCEPCPQPNLAYDEGQIQEFASLLWEAAVEHEVPNFAMRLAGFGVQLTDDRMGHRLSADGLWSMSRDWLDAGYTPRAFAYKLEALANAVRQGS